MGVSRLHSFPRKRAMRVRSDPSCTSYSPTVFFFVVVSAQPVMSRDKGTQPPPPQKKKRVSFLFFVLPEEPVRERH